MRFPVGLPAVLALVVSSLVAAPALALTEPNGTQIPLDGQNGEIELYTYFQSIGEPIDWLKDAGIKPDTFSPLCGFQAKYVLNQAGSHFGLAWYNATGVAPQPQDLHTILVAGSAVGTVFNSANIQSDPAYLGGAIGFALVGGQTHFSESKWDVQCTGCNPPGPWIGAIVYASKNTPNAFFLAFEDGGFSSDVGGFNNDGDFNDDVFFLTGLTCLGGGVPCMTGKPGICGPGLTVCSPSGVTCQQLTPAAAMETCNGVDDDCNGAVDDGNICPTDQVCDKGMCVPKCGSAEFKCGSGLVCAGGYCVDPACQSVTCPMGQACISGVCKAPCDGVVCPYPQVCRVGACVDPCAGVMCNASQVCSEGVCIQRCDCSPCPATKTCDMTSGSCVDPGCTGVTCPMGQHCASGGTCTDDCAGAMCPTGESCAMGACVADPNATTTGAGGSTGVFGAGVGTGGSNGFGGSSSHTGTTGGTGGAGGADQFIPTTKGGCGCRTAGDEGSMAGAIGAAMMAAGVAARRRRRG